MNEDKTIMNIKKLSDTFEKISKGIEKSQLDALDKEIVKIYQIFRIIFKKLYFIKIENVNKWL